jgi:hypothetical protein
MWTGEHGAMSDSSFKQNFHAYTQWKQHLIRTVKEYQGWLETQGLATPDAQHRVRSSLQTLEKDRLSVACVAEFSRGKTELINAVFFSDYGRRLLPSAAGRTTMCPTELLWDADRDEAYLRLLPIETRSQDLSVEQFKQNPKHWVQYPLNVDSPDQMQSTLQELMQTKRASVSEASRLGLYIGEPGDDEVMVEIPRWRHAIVSFPHPLLKQGLVILDTPGLNALGSEPELTLSTLPNAHAVLFLLAADTGVTRSDMEMWQHHVKGFQNSRRQGLMVVLNKIDTLWDELREEQEVRDLIGRQQESTARILGIDQSAIFPVSAQKGLLGKVRKDSELLHRSGLDRLENFLAEDMLQGHRQIVLDAIENEVGQLIENNRGLVSQQLNNVKHQLNELEELRDKSEEVIRHLLEKTRGEQALYLESVARFQVSRKEVQQEAKQIRELLDMTKIVQLMEQSHRDMLHSWTTRGMKKSMKFLFEELRRAMQAITTQAEGTRKRVRGIYRRFQNEFGFTTVQPYNFSTMKYRVELELLYKEADAFRRSPAVALSEQSQVVRRFFQVMGARARTIFSNLNEGLDEWLSGALDPLVNQIQEHKEMMEKRLHNLQKIGHSKSTLQVRIEDLEGQYAELARQLTALRNMHNAIHMSRPETGDAPAKPRLVAVKSA